jgi:dipeptidyl aminopeptidase/acylaminoacyl peptidase
MAKREKKPQGPVVEPDETIADAAGAATAVADLPADDTADPGDAEATAAEQSESVTDEAAAAEDETASEAEAVVADLPPVEPEPDQHAPLDDQLIPGEVSIDPTGKQAAFLQRDVNGLPWLWTLDLENGATMPLALERQEQAHTFIEEAGGPQWSPDGQFLALTARFEGSDRTHIRVVDVSTGVTAVIVRHPGSDSWPRWSPDGEWIAFVSERDGQQVIAVASSQGDGPATQLTMPPMGQRDREPTWDVKGGRLAFLRTQPPTETSVAGDHIWVVELATGAEKQLTKKVLGRHSLRWGPSRPLVLHVAQEADWDHIAVVNADNQAAWTISSEQGDKADPQWSADGNRVLFLRGKNGIVNCCDRATSAASSEQLDPGSGRAWSPRWLPGSTADRRMAFYAFLPATGGPRFYIQQNKKDAERDEVAAPGGWTAGDRSLIAPSALDFTLLKNLKTSGLFYRRQEGSGPAPAVIYLGDRPDLGPNAGYSPAAQALAAAGLAVYAPILPGASGAGRKLANARKDRTDVESEVDDLLEVITLLQENNGVDGSRIAVVGEGYGGALALVLAGSRPDAVQAAVAIDPIVDWDVALDQSEGAVHAWYLNNYGLPLANAGRYALRSPSTFAGVIEAPVLLIDRTPDEIHLPLLRSIFEALGRAYWSESARDEPAWATYARAATFIANAFRGTLEAPVQEAEQTAPVTPEVLNAAADAPAPGVAEMTAAGAPVEAVEPELELAEVEPVETGELAEPMDALAGIEAAERDEEIEALSDERAAAFLESMPDPERELEAGEEPEALEAHLASEASQPVAAPEPVEPAVPTAPKLDRPLVRPEEI